jgi:hypothetical protein
VFTASASGGQTRRIAAVRGRAYYNAEEGTWAGHLFGGGVVAYNVWETACDPPEGASCAPDDPWLQVYGARIVRARAGRGVVAKRGAVAYRLAAVGGGRMAVASTDGSVTVLSSRGTRLATTPGAGDLPLSTALGGTHLAVVRWNRTLDLYNARTGAKTRSLPLAEGAPDQLVGLNRRLALLERSRRLVLVRLADGRHLSLTPPPHFVGATLTARGLFYAYNVPRAHGGRIAFEPTVSLLKRF